MRRGVDWVPADELARLREAYADKRAQPREWDRLLYEASDRHGVALVDFYEEFAGVPVR